jgi:hypothetical protein
MHRVAVIASSTGWWRTHTICIRAEDLCPDGSIADAFQTVLARPTRDWMERTETVVERTVAKLGVTRL